MTISIVDTLAFLAAITAVLMVGSTHLRVNLWLFSVQTTFLSAVTACFAAQRVESNLWLIAGLLFTLKALAVPKFLGYVIKRVNVQRDSGTVIPTPIAMHISLAFVIVAYFLARQLPPTNGHLIAWPTATAAMSLVCTGLVLMLTRRVALSQIVGYLVMENGIFLFGLAQTHSMPLLIEMGIMLDVLSGVMIAGLITFGIKKNFEHIDVTQLTGLKE